MTETVASSTDILNSSPLELQDDSGEYVGSSRVFSILAVLFLVSLISQIDRMPPFIMAEAIKADLSLSDTEIGLLTGLAFAVCYALLSLPLAPASDRGSPRFVIVSGTLAWSAMTALGGLAATVACPAMGDRSSGHKALSRNLP